MSEIWVDTDMGFDDLWALILLRHLNCRVAGVSLVAGNAELSKVASNAAAAWRAYGFQWPVWQGANRPLLGGLETAAHVLGPSGMRTRGRQLDPGQCDLPPAGALSALHAWVTDGAETFKEILALGPLTNIALLLEAVPDLTKRIGRIVWMGGSAGAGNHTRTAEFNAYVDGVALDRVVASGLRLDIVELMFCRRVTFGAEDLPDTDPLTADLLGGYLDIALKRGRPGMAIYDPLAALAVACPDSITFQPCSIRVETDDSDMRGATRIEPAATSPIRYAVGAGEGLAARCLEALEQGHVHG